MWTIWSRRRGRRRFLIADMYAHSRAHVQARLHARIVRSKVTARTAGDKNVAVNLHHLLRRHTGARVQIIYVLRNEQEIFRVLGKSRDCFMRGVRSRIADALAAVRDTIPKLIADRARKLLASQALPDQDFSSNHPFREKSGCRFQPKHPRRSERGHAQFKIEKKLRFQNPHLRKSSALIELMLPAHARLARFAP